MRSLSAATSFLLAILVSCAHAQQIKRIEILDHGIYSVTVTDKKDEPGAVAGARVVVDGLRLTDSTTTVPAKLGVEFGFRYRTVGTPKGAPVQLKKITLIPPPGLQNPKTGNTMVRGEINFTERVGDSAYKGYHFSDPWELVPGRWTMELWQGDRKLVSESFDVVKP